MHCLVILVPYLPIMLASEFRQLHTSAPHISTTLTLDDPVSTNKPHEQQKLS